MNANKVWLLDTHIGCIFYIYIYICVYLCMCVRLWLWHWTRFSIWRCGHQWHDDVIKWNHFPRYCPFVRWIHRSPVNSPHKDQWRGALMFTLICVWINGWVNNLKTLSCPFWRNSNGVANESTLNRFVDQFIRVHFAYIMLTDLHCWYRLCCSIASLIKFHLTHTSYVTIYDKQSLCCGALSVLCYDMMIFGPNGISRVSCQKGSICHA